MKNYKNKCKNLLLLLVSVLFIVSGCGEISHNSNLKSVASTNQTNSLRRTDELIKEEYVTVEQLAGGKFEYSSIPDYSGIPYVEVNGNIPYFNNTDIVSESYELYGKLDTLGRCTSSIACLGKDIMPIVTEERGEIGNIKPTGWHSVKYNCVEGKYVMNRCHCIGWQLGAENANENNLVSGTRYMNLEMLVFENMVAEYIKETNNHVMYRVTPIFVGDELFCRGLLMEGYSVEDRGSKICYNVFFYNIQPGIEFNYQTGESWYIGIFPDNNSSSVIYDMDQFDSETVSDDSNSSEISPLPVEKKVTYVLNNRSMKFHFSDCFSVKKISNKNREIFEGNRKYIISIGYEPCEICNP